MGNHSQTMPLYWESTYEIALCLIEVYPNVDLDSVGLNQLQQWVINLPNFEDDPSLANDGILTEILRDWYEETH
jgi:FeS assembly protein IscX